jgi:cytochrome c553
LYRGLNGNIVGLLLGPIEKNLWEVTMKKLIWILAFACLPTLAFAQNAGPDWAYPANPPGAPPRDANKLLKVPGSDKTYNEVSANDAFGPADWFPNEHAAMPPAVANGRKPDVRACSLCHLTTGDGHPESANIAGLNAAYIRRTLNDFINGRRNNNRSPVMVTIAKAMTPDEIREASEYFAARKIGASYMKVQEAAEVPKTYVGEGAMRFVSAGNEKEPIGQRIIVVPQDEEGAKARNPHSGFVAYVPPGSVAKGEQLATTGGGGKTVPCAICHGEGLKGLGEVPSLASRDPMYLTRQLMDIKNGKRTGAWITLMQQVVAKLDTDDIIALSAYAASRQP